MPSDRDFQITVSRDGTRTSIELAGELDGDVAADLIAAFAEVTAQRDFNELVLDMTNVSFIDSAGMRAVIQIEQSARDQQLALVAMPPPPPITDLLRVTGLSSRLALGSPPPALEGEFLERIDLALPCDPTAPALARKEIRQALRDLSHHDLPVATLLTSELVTNSVLHSGQPTHSTVELRINAGPERLRVEVQDSGPGFDPGPPEPRAPEQGGRGLLLVDQLAARWGAGAAVGEGDRFSVWFELEAASAPGDGAAAPPTG